MTNSNYYLIVLFLISIYSCTNNEDNNKLKTLHGDFIGQSLPKDSSEVFAPGVISTAYNERDAAFSPDGNEFFYSLKGTIGFSLIQTKIKDGVWQSPEVASFSGKYSDIEPCFSRDGTKLFFVSNRPLTGEGEPKDYDIWFVEKINDGWGKPKNIGLPINTEANEFYPSFTEDGTIYFCANYKNGIGGEDLYYSVFKDGKYLSPINLGASVNSVRDEFNSFVSSDGNFIIFTSMGWGAGFGGGDLWISFRKDVNSWTKPKNMGKQINSPYFEYCPSITPDGKYFFFTSNRSGEQSYSETLLTYDKIIEGLNSTLNGSQNIYWISADFINGLNK